MYQTVGRKNKKGPLKRNISGDFWAIKGWKKERTSGGKPRLARVWEPLICGWMWRFTGVWSAALLWITWTLWLLQDLLAWTKDKSEVEIVDLLLKLRDKLVRPAASFGARHLWCHTLTCLPCRPGQSPTAAAPAEGRSSGAAGGLYQLHLELSAPRPAVCPGVKLGHTESH